MASGFKVCSCCSSDLPISEFTQKKKDGSERIRSKCRDCRNAYLREYYKRNREYALKYAKDRHWANLEENRAYARGRRLVREYGVTPDQYDALLRAQGGGCAICGDTGGMRHMMAPLVIDHDHATGAVRGLLCAGCNAGLGQFSDSVTKLAAAILYLQEEK